MSEPTGYMSRFMETHARLLGMGFECVDNAYFVLQMDKGNAVVAISKFLTSADGDICMWHLADWFSSQIVNARHLLPAEGTVAELLSYLPVDLPNIEPFEQPRSLVIGSTIVTIDQPDHFYLTSTFSANYVPYEVRRIPDDAISCRGTVLVDRYYLFKIILHTFLYDKACDWVKDNAGGWGPLLNYEAIE